MFDHTTLLSQGATDVGSVLLQNGAIGAMALVAMGIARILFKRLEEAYKQDRTHLEDSLKEEREAKKRAEDEVRELNASIRNQHIPALERATAVIAQTLRTSRRDDFHDDSAR